MPLVALAAGLVVLALILGVLLGMALAEGIDEGEPPYTVGEFPEASPTDSPNVRTSALIFDHVRGEVRRGR